jgi:zinc protease
MSFSKWIVTTRFRFFFYLILIFSVSERTTAMDLSEVESFNVGEIPVILRSTSAFGDIVAFEITARGTVTTPTKAGQLELLLDTMGHGTTSYTKEEIDRIFAENGAVFGVEPRADYVEVSLKCLKQFLGKLLPVMSEMLRSPTLSSQEIEISRSQMMSHLRSEADHPDPLLQLIISKAFYKDHPYALRPSGYLETVPSITRDELLQLLPKLFNKQNLLFTVIGNLTRADVTSLIENFFAKLPNDERAKIVDQPPQNPIGELVFAKKDSPTTYFIAKFKAPSLMDEDYPALVLATEILHHRLFEEVRTKRGLTYSVSSALGNSAINAGYLYVTSTQLPEAVSIMFDEVKKMQTEKIDPKTLELQVRKFTSTWYLGREQASSQATILALYEILGNTWKNADGFIARLNKVTPEAMLLVSQKYFKDFTYGVVGPEKPNLSLPGMAPSITASPSPSPTAKPSAKPTPKAKSVKK